MTDRLRLTVVQPALDRLVISGSSNNVVVDRNTRGPQGPQGPVADDDSITLAMLAPEVTAAALGGATPADVATAVAAVTTTSLGAVPTSRTVSATSPLTGGGALSGNVTVGIQASSASQAGSMSATQAAQLAALNKGVVPSVQVVTTAGPTQILPGVTYVDCQYTGGITYLVLPTLADAPLNTVITIGKSAIDAFPISVSADPASGIMGSVGVPYVLVRSDSTPGLTTGIMSWDVWRSLDTLWLLTGVEQQDQAASIASLRTLGTGATQAAAGNDARLSDTRTPTDASVTMAKHANLAASTVIGRPAGSTGVPSALAVAHSLIADGTGLRLSGDAASPSGMSSYGTDDAGTRGWFADSPWDAMRTMPTYGKRRTIVCSTDFLGASGSGSSGHWLSDVSNGANTFPVTDTVGRVGITRSSTTGSAVGAAGWRCSIGDIILGLGRISFRADVRITQLSNGTESFTVRAGIGEMYTNVLPVDGAYFRYAHGTNSGKWQCVVVANSVEATPVDSGIAVVAGTWYVLECEVNAAATQARYWIDGVLVATISSGFPAATMARASDAGMRIWKAAGTTAVTMDTDYLAMRWDLTTPM